MRLLNFVVILVFISTVSTADIFLCYLGSWAVYRPGIGRFDIEDIDPFLCTHLVYTFVGISSDGTIKILDRWNDIDKKAFERFTNLKNVNPSLKTMVAVGGWNEGSATFSQVAANPTLRTKFVQNSVHFLKQHRFDGLDIDWEYPGRRGGTTKDKDNFTAWLKEFRQVFDKYGFLVSAGVSSTSSTAEVSYDVPALSKYLDFINVMTYDLHGEWDGKTGHNSPLYASSLDKTHAEKELNVDACIQGWLTKGAKPEKLILGIPLYGHSFRLRSSNNNSLGAPISGPGAAGPYTRQPGVLGYNEIVEVSDQPWTFVWDHEQNVPHAYKGDQWVGFDNVPSITLKVDYVKKFNLGGVMVWSIETDDFHGVNGTKNPLLNTIRSNLDLKPPLTSSTSTTSTTQKPPETFVCSKEGYFRDPVDCSKFYYCLLYGGGFLKYPYRCPGDLVFNEKKLACDYRSNDPCITN